MIRKTPLEAWIQGKVSERFEPLTREKIEAYQLQKLKETIAWVKERSKFYRNILADVDPEDIKSLEEISKLPFTDSADVREKGWKFLCVPQDSIHRIVTLQTSGTTGEKKRIYFTEEEQEQTVDFFHHGMTSLAEGGDRILILMPGERPGSVGDLLKKGVERFGAAGIIYGAVDDPQKVWDVLEKESINVIVGIPQQVYAVAKYGIQFRKNTTVKIKSVLLSADYVSDAIIGELKEKWNCKVFEHYGMTEMGFGGGVSCEALQGYHLREADLYFEVIDPDTGKVLEDGQYGEVVFTTLTRKGMPLIRYRTGDWGRFLQESCPCGTILKRLDKIRYRIDSSIFLANTEMLTISELDEILFAIGGILDFDVVIMNKMDRECLMVWIY
ncbi:MAG TPA: phenylacetate--CoA ligase family protein, partial [Clostridiales bacterium]|nr:phenylacetate--CoA ligase family protein [Clostridiales bacterium]